MANSIASWRHLIGLCKIAGMYKDESIESQFKATLDTLQSLHNKRIAHVAEDTEKWRQVTRSLQNEKAVIEAKLQQALIERDDASKRLQSREIQYLQLLEKYNALKRTTEQLQMLKTSIASLVEAKENTYSPMIIDSDSKRNSVSEMNVDESAALEQEVNELYDDVRKKLSEDDYTSFAENIKRLNNGQSIDVTLTEVKRLLDQWPNLYNRFKQAISGALVSSHTKSMNSEKSEDIPSHST